MKKIEDIDCQKTIKDINFTDLKNLFFRTRTKKYGYFVIMHSSLKNRAGVLSLMHWNKRSSEQERRVDALALRAEERRDKLRKAAGRSKCPLIRRCLNGETRLEELQSLHAEYIGMQGEPGELKHLSSRRKRKKNRFPK